MSHQYCGWEGPLSSVLVIGIDNVAYHHHDLFFIFAFIILHVLHETAELWATWASAFSIWWHCFCNVVELQSSRTSPLGWTFFIRRVLHTWTWSLATFCWAQQLGRRLQMWLWANWWTAYMQSSLHHWLCHRRGLHLNIGWASVACQVTSMRLVRFWTRYVRSYPFKMAFWKVARDTKLVWNYGSHSMPSTTGIYCFLVASKTALCLWRDKSVGTKFHGAQLHDEKSSVPLKSSREWPAASQHSGCLGCRFCHEATFTTLACL